MYISIFRGFARWPTGQKHDSRNNNNNNNDDNDDNDDCVCFAIDCDWATACNDMDVGANAGQAAQRNAVKNNIINNKWKFIRARKT